MKLKPPALGSSYSVTLAVLTVGTFAAGWLTAGSTQGVLFAIGSVLASWLTIRADEERSVVIRLLIWLGAAGLMFWLVMVSTWYVTRNTGTSAGNTPLPYPRSDGLIADFASGPGGPVRSALGLQFSILSDSAWNLSSKVWYERVDGSGSDENGFLRIHYQLEPSKALGPYVGLYVDFSTPPPVPYDLSRFARISMRLRSEPSIPDAVDLALVLYSANVTNFEYAFPRWQIPRQNLRAEWTTVKGSFNDFGRPPFVSYDVPLNPSRTYRLGLVISTPNREPAHGHIDVDDLRFE